ncbi:hypothetical protein Ae406Ps2_5995 [Pseudonocardia sp. Ae406_Ps2]|nr:hypothetical protein Ae406Ps2_5995 [Pseudonocardia sp. Ae406_Ps2]
MDGTTPPSVRPPSTGLSTPGGQLRLRAEPRPAAPELPGREVREDLVGEREVPAHPGLDHQPRLGRLRRALPGDPLRQVGVPHRVHTRPQLIGVPALHRSLHRRVAGDDLLVPHPLRVAHRLDPRHRRVGQLLRGRPVSGHRSPAFHRRIASRIPDSGSACRRRCSASCSSIRRRRCRCSSARYARPSSVGKPSASTSPYRRSHRSAVRGCDSGPCPPSTRRCSVFRWRGVRSTPPIVAQRVATPPPGVRPGCGARSSLAPNRTAGGVHRGRSRRCA